MDLFARCYLNSMDQPQLLRDWFAGVIQGQLHRRDVEGPDLRLHLTKNEEADGSRTDGEDGFLYFPFTMEIEAQPGKESGFEQALCALVEALLSRGEPFVVAWSDEHRLPAQGRSPPQLVGNGPR